LSHFNALKNMTPQGALHSGGPLFRRLDIVSSGAPVRLDFLPLGQNLVLATPVRIGWSDVIQ